MAAGSTYTPIATTTLGSSATSVDFSSFSGYTDLVLIVSAKAVSSADDLGLRFNSDSGTNYSYTVLTGNGSSAASARAANMTFAVLDYNASVRTGDYSTHITHIQNYSNTSTYKTVLCRANTSTGVDASVNLWRNTSAITAIRVLLTTGVSFASGSTFTLYGIAAA
jgi:hypothetical protein